MFLNIEEYLNGLPDDVVTINVSSRGLTYLPDLSRFHNLLQLICSYNYLTSLPPLNNPKLRYLCCDNNRLTRLPPLNPNLENLQCSFNQLTSLPPLNQTIKILFCYNNLLNSLPPLNQNLKTLDCSSNRLTSLPPLINTNLEILNCYNNLLTSLPFLPPPFITINYMCNPINDIIYVIMKTHINKNKKSEKQIINLLFQFKYLYYSLKFKSRFHNWLWVKVREPKIQQKYSPINLVKLLRDIDENDEEHIDRVLSNW